MNATPCGSSVDQKSKMLPKAKAELRRNAAKTVTLKTLRWHLKLVSQGSGDRICFESNISNRKANKGIKEHGKAHRVPIKAAVLI